MKQRIGFIGLGLMGEPMARNVLKAGFDLTVYNRTASKTRELQKLGAKVANSPKEVAYQSDIVITVVTGPKDVQEVLFGKNGVVKGLSKGSVVIDMSTIGPQAAQAQFKQLSEQQIDFLDAPVTGGTGGAINGTLTIFVGGKQSVYKKALPVLQSMGKDVFYIGESGMGQAIKLVNNLIVGSTLTALAEGMILADAQGLSRKKVQQFLGNVPAVSPMMRTRLENMVKGKYKVTFSVANMHKDLALAVEELKKGKGDAPVLKLVEKLYGTAKKQGQSELDNSSILQLLERL